MGRLGFSAPRRRFVPCFTNGGYSVVMLAPIAQVLGRTPRSRRVAPTTRSEVNLGHGRVEVPAPHETI